MEKAPADDTDRDTLKVESFANLGASPALAVGTHVLVEEDGWLYINTGQAPDDIEHALGWEHENIWMPQHVLRYISRHHPVISDPVLAMSAVLRQPLSVHQDLKAAHHRYLIADAELLRAKSLLASRSTRYVDAVVELRRIHGGRILRAFHLSPTKQNRGGRQLWP